ncbi:MAG: hypothetical protein WBL28_00025 [Methylotenera sp.]
MNSFNYTSKPYLNTNRITSEVATWLSDSYGGYYVTVNSLRVKDTIYFEQQIINLVHKLNDFCLGRSYQRREKQLNIVACLEYGKVNGNLHAHLLITYKDADIKRSYQEVNAYIGKQWHKTIGQKRIFSDMVNVLEIGDISSRVSYSVKDTHFLMRKDFFNVLFL